MRKGSVPELQGISCRPFSARSRARFTRNFYAGPKSRRKVRSFSLPQNNRVTVPELRLCACPRLAPPLVNTVLQAAANLAILVTSQT
eukprot:scaffold104738_cov67-Phaeocystis_antarctica.AAC.4